MAESSAGVMFVWEGTDKQGKNRVTPIIEVNQLSLPPRLKVVSINDKDTTLAGTIEVGITAGSAEYVLMDLGVAAATDVYNTLDDTDAIVLADLPADTQVEVTFNAPTGGTPAGIGRPYVDIAWY